MWGFVLIIGVPLLVAYIVAEWLHFWQWNDQKADERARECAARHAKEKEKEEVINYELIFN